MVSRRVVISLLATLTGAALVLGTGGPAAAAARAGNAPGCIARVVDEQPHGLIVWLRNECGRTMRVKVVISWGPDGPCATLANGQSREWTFKLGSYDKTVTC
ncbi:hypothetical protein [Nonomuraea rubra]|uniref:Alpha-amylase n=1 Tax=Nonomuraea rubra TaxID=46180 RepID=A0A7X0NQS9_9ACTN|nr:hypothetical protein [Nonomuraea rubra]MBB6547834.1 hypothetical protein [Nonomuraea rubra]